MYLGAPDRWFRYEDRPVVEPGPESSNERPGAASYVSPPSFLFMRIIGFPSGRSRDRVGGSANPWCGETIVYLFSRVC